MFSRLALSTVRITPAARANIQAKCVLAIQTRCTSDIRKHIENWDKVNDMFYGKDRDFQNFPKIKQEDRCPPVRMGFIPETWFQALYEKTGVTGPYLLGATAITALLSKELWVVEHYFTDFVSFWLLMFIIIKKVGPRLGAYLDEKQEKYVEKRWHGPIAKAKSSSLQNIQYMETCIWREEGQKYLHEAKRENVGLQLEEEFRKRQVEVYQAVKRRLDYQMETENTKRRFEQNHMVNWIVDNVVKGITPQQERDSISKCIADLKAIGQKTQVAAV